MDESFDNLKQNSFGLLSKPNIKLTACCAVAFHLIISFIINVWEILLCHLSSIIRVGFSVEIIDCILVLVVESVGTGTMIQLEATMTSDIVPQCQKWQGSHIGGIFMVRFILVCLNISRAMSILQQTLQMMNCVKQRNFYVKLFETCQGRVTSAHTTLLITHPNFGFYLNSFRHEFLDLYFLLTIFSVTNQGHYEAVLSSSPLYCPHHEPSPGPGVQ